MGQRRSTKESGHVKIITAGLDREAMRGAFDEDRLVRTAVHKGMANQRTPHLDLKIDVEPMRFRCNLAKLIEAEQSRKAVSSRLSNWKRRIGRHGRPSVPANSWC